MINCPNCGKPLGEIPSSGVLVAMCAHCRFKFEARRGVVLGFIGGASLPLVTTLAARAFVFLPIATVLASSVVAGLIGSGIAG